MISLIRKILGDEKGQSRAYVFVRKKSLNRTMQVPQIKKKPNHQPEYVSYILFFMRHTLLWIYN